MLHRANGSRGAANDPVRRARRPDPTAEDGAIDNGFDL